ncbi:MAG: UDP-N-acetylmuramoyl-tripeptide--D-alanyl-D-alanine ligase [Clostridia bacterium]|nr:UDP-N-acetylmuramoyl-tripeptide--D-alanyl-D-alanine ligase [Clostridia bacterium]
MPTLLIVSAVILCVSLVFSLYRQVQMFQQNSYFPSRYSKWVYGSFNMEVTFLSFGFCLNSFLLFQKAYLLSVIFCGIILAVRAVLAVNTYKKSIKKLVFTARVKRFTAVSVAVLVILLSVMTLSDNILVPKILFTVLEMLCFISPLFLLVIWLITAPMEKAISSHYINDAKKILKNNPQITVIGITGSFGKTTTKFILNRILSEKFNTVCTPQSFNTPMGVVRTVRGDIKPNTQIFICEMGAKKNGDIKEICDIAHPKYGIITSVGAQHLDTFGSIDNVFNTKFELANEVAKNGGLTFINAESEDIASRYDKGDKTLVLFGGNSDYRAENIVRNSFGSNFDLVLKDKRIPVSTKLLGLHSIYDILAAAAISFNLGVDENSIRVAVSSLKPTEHRLELKSYINGSLLIDDAYNSNPVGCLEAVRTLGAFENYKKVIITPGLIELGKKEYDANYSLGLEAAKYCDIIILVGQNRSKPMMDAINTTDFNKDNVFVVSSFKEAMEVYTPKADKNSVVLLENDLPDNYLN